PALLTPPRPGGPSHAQAWPAVPNGSALNARHKKCRKVAFGASWNPPDGFHGSDNFRSSDSRDQGPDSRSSEPLSLRNRRLATLQGLPMNGEELLREQHKLIATPKHRPVRVLVVNDSPDNVASMALLLRLYGHEVDGALGGAAALRAAQAQQP